MNYYEESLSNNQGKNADQQIDNKIVKRHYPRNNNGQVLDFVFGKDPNLYLRKNKILIKGAIEIDDNYVTENGFVAKLFGMLTVDVDSHTISSNRAKGEYFLIDYIQKIGNFNCNTIETMFQLEGYHDFYNFDSKQLFESTKLISHRKLNGILSGTKRIYEFMFIPNCGFLNSNMPLLNNCELKLSFDRVNADVSLLKGPVDPKAAISTDTVDSLAGKPIKIIDCYAITEYISSEYHRNYFDRIDTQPIQYQFEECDITLTTLPINQTDIRLDNIRGGNSPTCLFLGIIPTNALNGDLSKSSVAFRHNNVKTVNITLNGKTVNGYPLEITNNSPVTVIQKHFDVTNRFMNPLASQCQTFSEFKSNWIYSHRFEAETTSQGWLGVHLELSEVFTIPYTLVIWSINTSAITIDKFHQIEKVLL